MIYALVYLVFVLQEFEVQWLYHQFFKNLSLFLSVCLFLESHSISWDWRMRLDVASDEQSVCSTQFWVIIHSKHSGFSMCLTFIHCFYNIPLCSQSTSFRQITMRIHVEANYASLCLNESQGDLETMRWSKQKSLALTFNREENIDNWLKYSLYMNWN